MAANVKTFGGAISEARKAKGWALKDLASRVLREDEEAISPQYLNDIEHDRRSPSSLCAALWAWRAPRVTNIGSMRCV